MTGIDAIRTSLRSTQHLVTWFLGDLSDADLLVRPVEGANHIAWQMGHLIQAERRMICAELPGAGYPDLPAGFAERHTKETAAVEPPAGLRRQGHLPRRVHADARDDRRGPRHAHRRRPRPAQHRADGRHRPDARRGVPARGEPLADARRASSPSSAASSASRSCSDLRPLGNRSRGNEPARLPALPAPRPGRVARPVVAVRRRGPAEAPAPRRLARFGFAVYWLVGQVALFVGWTYLVEAWDEAGAVAAADLVVTLHFGFVALRPGAGTAHPRRLAAGLGVDAELLAPAAAPRLHRDRRRPGRRRPRVPADERRTRPARQPHARRPARRRSRVRRHPRRRLRRRPDRLPPHDGGRGRRLHDGDASLGQEGGEPYVGWRTFLRRNCTTSRGRGRSRGSVTRSSFYPIPPDTYPYVVAPFGLLLLLTWIFVPPRMPGQGGARRHVDTDPA